jgi:hypothetical protein
MRPDGIPILSPRGADGSRTHSKCFADILIAAINRPISATLFGIEPKRIRLRTASGKPTPLVPYLYLYYTQISVKVNYIPNKICKKLFSRLKNGLTLFFLSNLLWSICSRSLSPNVVTSLKILV